MLKMNCDKASCRIRKMKILLKGLMFLFNATLWILVLFFSVDENEVAALLSYVTVTFTVITMKYYLWGVVNNSESIAFFIDFPSRILILAAIFFAFHHLWNTAFYSICLGIVLQKVKCEVEDRAAGFGPYLNAEISGDNKNDCNDQLNSRNFEDIAHEIEINEYKENDLNAVDFRASISLFEKNDEYLENLSEERNIHLKHIEYTQKDDKISSKLQEFHRNILETVNCHEKISPNKDNCYGNEEFNKVENILNDDNYTLKQCSNLIETDEPSLKRKKYRIQPESELNYANTIKIQRNGSLCTMKVNLVDLKELKLSECSELEHKFELNESNIKRELKRNEESVDFRKKDEDVSNENLKDLPKDEAILSTSNRMKTISEFEGKENGLSVGQVNLSSNAFKDSSFYQNNYDNPIAFKQDKEMEINVKSVQLYKDITKLFNGIKMSGTDYLNNQNTAIESQCEVRSKIEKNSEVEYTNMNSRPMETTNLHPEERTDEPCQTKCIPEQTYESISICLGHNQIGEDFNTDFEVNQENFVKEIDFQKNVSKNNENCELEIKYGDTNCQSLKTSDTHLAKNVNICETKCFSQQINVENLKSVSQKKNEIFCELENYVEPECLSKAEIFCNNSRLNESANVEESINANEPVTQVSGNTGTQQFTNVSNVEDVVNKIDLSFIYALGFNV